MSSVSTLSEIRAALFASVKDSIVSAAIDMKCHILIRPPPKRQQWPSNYL
jgi:hypothetical protein